MGPQLIGKACTLTMVNALVMWYIINVEMDPGLGVGLGGRGQQGWVGRNQGLERTGYNRVKSQNLRAYEVEKHRTWTGVIFDWS